MVYHKCSFSYKRFLRPPHRDRHLRTHTGEKPFPCQECWKCDYCYKRFCRPSQREWHMRTCTGEQPFSCAQCRKRFARRCVKYNQYNLSIRPSSINHSQKKLPIDHHIQINAMLHNVVNFRPKLHMHTIHVASHAAWNMHHNQQYIIPTPCASRDGAFVDVRRILALSQHLDFDVQPGGAVFPS